MELWQEQKQDGKQKGKNVLIISVIWKKRQYNEKIIPKFIDNNGDEVVDQFKILNEQKVFYEKLYSSSNPVINMEDEDFFLYK